MNFIQIETFYWVATIGSFQRTAEKMHTTQPAVSARISKLEQSLGVALFDRTGRQARLTPKGLALVAYAEKLLSLRDDIYTSISTDPKASGIIRIGVSDTMALTWFPDFLALMRAQYPELVIEIHAGISDILRADLVDRQLDIAFLVDAVNGLSMNNWPFCSYQMIWTAAPALGLPRGVLSAGDLTKHDIFTFQRTTRPYQDLMEGLRRVDVSRARVNGFGSLQTVINVVKKGMGVGAVPAAAVRDDLAEGTLIELRTDLALNDIVFNITFPSTPVTSLPELIATLAREHLQEYLDENNIKEIYPSP